MSVSEAKKRANARWNASKDNIMIRPTKEEGTAIRSAAAAAGQSNQQYILQATRERMERDGGTSSEIVQNGPESTQGAGVVSLLPSEGVRMAHDGTEMGKQPVPIDRVKAWENILETFSDVGTMDLDKARCERLGIMYLPQDTLEAAQQAAKRTGETVTDFVARAVAEQQERDDRSFKMGINPS